MITVKPCELMYIYIYINSSQTTLTLLHSTILYSCSGACNGACRIFLTRASCFRWVGWGEQFLNLWNLVSILSKLEGTSHQSTLCLTYDTKGVMLIKYSIWITNSWQIQQSSRLKLFIYDDVIKWKHFPRYWPFVRGIHRSFPTQRPVTRRLVIWDAIASIMTSL